MKTYPLPTIIESPLRELREERAIALIASGPALAAAEVAGLRLDPLWRAEPGAATEVRFAALAAQIPTAAEVVYGVGGGLAADAAKFAAWRRGLPLVVVPTALSVDAHLTWAAGVRCDGCVTYLKTGPAHTLYADYALLGVAPVP